jgi:acyl-CoA synthetase (AMP-forming)/AMP-acid ligase II
MTDLGYKPFDCHNHYEAVDSFTLYLDPANAQRSCRELVAGYKIPRQLTTVATMQRSPAGKADYPWAQDVATTDPNAEVQTK